jgi:hypothetical protein
LKLIGPGSTTPAVTSHSRHARRGRSSWRREKPGTSETRRSGPSTSSLASFESVKGSPCR